MAARQAILRVKPKKETMIVSEPFYVLFADPNPHICDLLQRELRALPCKTETVYTARTLAEKIHSRKENQSLPDLLVLDPSMPGIPMEYLLKFLYEDVSLPLIVLHSIQMGERLTPAFADTNPVVFVEKNHLSPVLIRRIVEGKTKTNINS